MPMISRQASNGRDPGHASLPVQELRTGSFLLPGVVFTAVILLLLGFTGSKVIDPETLPIRNVSVAGDFTHLSPTRLQNRVSNVVRGGFFSVNVEKIQQVLLEEPWIRDVSVKRVWPDRITVTIREQTAVAQWGNEGLLNENAEIFRPEHSTFPAGLPVVNGPENSSAHVLEMLGRIREILPRDFSVRQLTMSERRSWELTLDSGPVIRLGKAGVIKRMQRFLEHLPAEGLNSMAQIQYIDMRYTNGFALSRKPENKAALEVIQENYGEEI